MITYTLINEDLVFEAFQDRIIVLEDGYKSGRECPKCEGKGHLGVTCKYCKGTTLYNGKEDNGSCKDCEIGTSDLRESLGFEPCPVCKGTRTSSIIIPDDAQQRPTTGVVKSLGALCGKLRIAGEWLDLPEEAKLKEGDRVAYTSFSGNIFEFPKRANQDKFTIRILKEAEVLYIVRGALKKSLQEGGFEELKSVGVE